MIKKVKLIRNGDHFYPGLTYTVSSTRHKTLDSLLDELTDTTLCDKRVLPKGVRYLFTLEGFGPLKSLDDLNDGETYICSSTKTFINANRHRNNQIINIKSNKLTLQNNNNHASLPSSPLFSKRHVHCRGNCESNNEFDEDFDETKDFIKPKLVTIIRNGPKPRKLTRVLLNKKTACSMEQALDEINKSIKLDSGALKKVYLPTGKAVSCLKDFFGDESLFFAYGNEKFSPDDLELTSTEIVQASSHKPLSIGAHCSPLANRKNWTPTNGRSPANSRGNSFVKLHASDSQPTNHKAPISEKVNDTKSDRGPIKINVSRIPNEPAALRLNYKINEVIGRGRFAVVKRCIELSTKNERALKIVDKRDIKKEEQALLKNEVEMLKKIHHKNIVESFEDWETDTHLYFILEFVNNGDLFDLVSLMTSYPEKEASQMLHDVSGGVVYLHSLNIVHRDIKPENILVHMHRDDSITLKIGDLGLATLATEPLFTVCGTPTYVAPEVISETGYGLAVDVWSLGILTYILLCGYPPFSSDLDDQDELFDQIQAGKFEFEAPYWDHVTDEAKGFIKDMLSIDPLNRLKADQVYNHPWIMQHFCNGHDNKQPTTTTTSSEPTTDDKNATTSTTLNGEHPTTTATTTGTTTATASTTEMKSNLTHIQATHRLPQIHSAPGVLNGLMDKKLKYMGCRKHHLLSPHKKHPPSKED